LLTLLAVLTLLRLLLLLALLLLLLLRFLPKLAKLLLRFEPILAHMHRKLPNPNHRRTTVLCTLHQLIQRALNCVHDSGQQTWIQVLRPMM
jgi:hypothetical protein